MKIFKFYGCSLAAVLSWSLAGCTKAESQDEQASTDLQSASASVGACSAGQVHLVVSGINASGTLELLAPIIDSGGYNQKVYDLSMGHCMPRHDIDELVQDSSGSSASNIDILVAYDPNGTSEGYRRRFEFEADPGEPDVKPPMPPKDMKFGEAVWEPANNQLSVAWYPPTSEWFEQFAGYEPSWSVTEAAAIERWRELNGKCRGGSGDNPETFAACEERDGPAAQRLSRFDICYGRQGEAGYQMTMHRCGPDSTRWN